MGILAGLCLRSVATSRRAAGCGFRGLGSGRGLRRAAGCDFCDGSLRHCVAAVLGYLAGGAKCFPRDAARIGDPSLVAARIAAGLVFLLEDAAAGGAEIVRDMLKVGGGIDLDTEVRESRRDAADRNSTV